MSSEKNLKESSSGEIMARARRARLVVPAFNIPYLPMMKPVIEAVRDASCFAFVAVARLEWTKFEAGGVEPVREEYERWKDLSCVRLHLDHVPVIDEDNLRVDYLPIIERAIALGYDSVMVDGSRLPLEENLAATRRVVEISAGLPVEAELGAVLGHEEGPPLSYEEIFASKRGFTDVEQARTFARESGCSWLSVAIGSIHGAVSRALRDAKKATARLDLGQLAALAEATRLPLVLHGGSGIEHAAVREAVKRGITKINIGTEIRQAYEQALRAGGGVEEARRRTYDRTRWVIRDFLGLEGSLAKLTQ